MKNKLKKIPIIALTSEDCAEPDKWFRMDKKSDRDKLIKEFKNNPGEHFYVKNISQKQWEKAVKLGKS